MHINTVDIIIPVYNEEQNVLALYLSLEQVFNDLPLYEYSIIFVDDGSTDRSLGIIKNLSHYNSKIKFTSFSRNFGHQVALKAGLDLSSADCVISMDADLQHPAYIIPQMLAKWEEGSEIVYTVRKDDARLSFRKRKASKYFYKILNLLSDIELEEGCADFRLLSRRVVDIVKQMQESDLFLRGLVKWVGFKQFALHYQPKTRNGGATKYRFIKMMNLALNGITSFSNKPLHLAAYLGFIFSVISLLYIPYALYSYVFGYTISGWTSLIVTIAFFAGLQLTILGIIGIYIGKLFMHSKNRPVYIIKETNISCKQEMAGLYY